MYTQLLRMVNASSYKNNALTILSHHIHSFKIQIMTLLKKSVNPK